MLARKRRMLPSRVPCKIGAANRCEFRCSTADTREYGETWVTGSMHRDVLPRSRGAAVTVVKPYTLALLVTALSHSFHYAISNSEAANDSLLLTNASRASVDRAFPEGPRANQRPFSPVRLSLPRTVDWGPVTHRPGPFQPR